MWIEGNLTRDGKYWLAEFPGFAAFTQGRTKKEALEMARDMLEGLAEAEGFDMDISVVAAGSNMLRAGADDVKSFTAFILRRWRQAHNITLRQAAEQLGATSLTAYARYEQGHSEPSVSMLEKLIQSISPGEPLRLIFGAGKV